MAKQFTLGKAERLKSRKLIDQLFSEGKRFTLGAFRVQYQVSYSDNAVLQFGIGVGVKQFRKAVDRNRVKRLVRESYRLQKKDLQAFLKENNQSLLLFLIYTGKTMPSYGEVYENIGRCLLKLSKILQELK